MGERRLNRREEGILRDLEERLADAGSTEDVETQSIPRWGLLLMGVVICVVLTAMHILLGVLAWGVLLVLVFGSRLGQ